MSTADLPPATQEFLHGIWQRAELTFDSVLVLHGKARGLGLALAEARVALLDQELAPIVEAMAAKHTPVACAKGCHCCCTTTVEATPDEVFALMDHLEENLGPEALAAVKARAVAADARGHGLASVERHKLRLFCPVLDPATGACLGHGARPAPCQGYLSLSLPRCEADYRDPPGTVPQPEAAGMITSVVSGTRDAVLDDQGLARGGLELTAALVAAWATPDAEERWLRGETVLAEAAYVPSDPADYA